MEAEPELTPETRRRLHAELDDIAETPGTSDEVPSPEPVKKAGIFAQRGALIAGTFFVALVVGIAASAWAGSWFLVLVALAVHAIGTLVVLLFAAGMLSESEHASPELAEDLRSEGV